MTISQAWIPKMIFQIFKFFGIATALTKGGEIDQRNELLWKKLQNYQTVTGLSNETMISIWQKSEAIRAGVTQG